MPPHKAAAKLRELGDTETALAIENVLSDVKTANLLKENYDLRSEGAELFSYQFEDFTNIVWTEPKAYQNTSHVFGYIAPPPDGGYKSKLVDINHAGTIAPHAGLKNKRIVITLDRLRVANYPGEGMHQILFDFYAQNQLKDNLEHLHFNQTFRAQEGNDVAVIGYPIFIGLNVGSQGINFKCFTVNVKNEDDEAILRFLDNDVFQAGLKLVNTIQPAIAPLTGLAVGLTKLIAGRNKNVPVQDFYMGLDFSSVPTRARLAEGSYLGGFRFSTN